MSTALFACNFAYKYVMVAAMISQIEHYAPRLHLPIDTPVKKQHIRFLSVSPAFVNGQDQVYGGRLQVTNYSFTFAPNWHNIFNLDEHGFISLGVPMGRDEPSNSGMERTSQMKYIINTNDIYGIASN